MEIEGILTHILERKEGTSSRGTQWVQQDIVIETLDDYPKNICLQCRGSLTRQIPTLTIGQKYLFSFDIDAREWKGRYFNIITCKTINNLRE